MEVDHALLLLLVFLLKLLNFKLDLFHLIVENCLLLEQLLVLFVVIHVDLLTQLLQVVVECVLEHCSSVHPLRVGVLDELVSEATGNPLYKL